MPANIFSDSGNYLDTHAVYALPYFAGQAFTGRFQTRDFAFTNTTAYQYYRLTITANAGGVNLLQLAEFGLSDGVTTGDPVSWKLQGSYDGTMWTTVDERVNQTFQWRLQTREFAVHNLERQRRQGARGRAVDHRRALAWIIVRIMTRAFESLLLCCPPIHLTTRVRTNRGIGNNAVGRAIPG